MILLERIRQYLTIFRAKVFNRKCIISWRSTIFNSTFCDYSTINDGVIISNSFLGKYSYINYNSLVNNTTILNFTSVGPGCVIGIGNHPTRHYVSTSPYLYKPICFQIKQTFDEHPPVFIGNDVWIGANVTICNGVNIGDGAIIAANSVVNSDVPPYAIYGGLPAKLIRFRFENNQIDKLLTIQWWNKEQTWLESNAKYFHDINLFLQEEKYNNS